ncbi:MAG: proline--tRNA ligase [Proteobacteria bacterium]|nr:proline--tRNA ligase [Pseudomonadota bacterium]
MRCSNLYLPTLKETPADAEIVSHRLMLRAGMIRKVAAGIYNLLPYGLAAVRRVENVVREEMNRAGAQEIMMPAVQPAELWEESGRWEHYGRELLRFVDRHNHPFCLGPTHEEVVTALVRGEVRSYRQLPVNLYQIQTKFRDEIRPRFGLMRGREFIMKDGYSFDVDDDAAAESYRRMYEAYGRVFERLGLGFRAVEADTGAIGGSFSHEFMVLADTGEDEIAVCRACDYAANIEKAEVKAEDGPRPTAAEEVREVHTPGMHTVAEVCDFLKIDPTRLVKTIILLADESPVAALVRGDHELNLVKIRNLLGAVEVELADPSTVERVSGAAVGFAGPVGLDGPIHVDAAVALMADFVTGANQDDYHLTGVNLGRDFKAMKVADIRAITALDSCPRCGGEIEITRGIEVGHIFRLGTKYSTAMGANFTAEDGEEKPMVMGCYGIGIGRTVAASIEQNHDENGIIFPLPMAPYQVVVLPVAARDEEVRRAAEELYHGLSAAGLDALLDDRDLRAGVKFKDADLLGVPLRLTVGQKALAQGKVELKKRAEKDFTLVARGEAVAAVAELATAGRTA